MPLLFLISTTCWTQVHENFENGLPDNLSQSAPKRWDVTSIEAISGEQSLQHVFDNNEAGHDQVALKHPLLMFDSLETTWSFRLRHGHNPSSSNNWCVFPASDGSVDRLTPEKINNAYCLGVNFTGSDDLLKLWKIENGIRTTLINTGFNWQDSIGTEMAPYIELKRDPSGRWEIFINAEGGKTPLKLLGIAHDDNWNITAAFDIYYAYTKTYDRALWFDDLHISGYFYQDHTPPHISDAYFLTDTLLKIQLSETYAPGSISDAHISTGHENYIKQFIVNSPEELLLVLDTNTMQSRKLSITIGSIADLSGNVMPDTTIHVPHYPEQAHDILITEVMADPSPPVGLPEAEYLELYNTTDHRINLYRWKLQVGSKEFELPDVHVRPNDYILICKNDQGSLFEAFGNILPLFTNVYTLRNRSDTIILTNEKDEVINNLVYHDHSHTSSDKQNGGWSLEIIDPENQCNPGQNWTSSIHSSGGTPGSINSAHGFNLDTTLPGIDSWEIIHASEIQLTFSEAVQMTDSQVSDFNLGPAMGNPVSIQSANHTTLRLTFEKNLVLGREYVLSIAKITDLCDNTNKQVKIDIPYYKAYPFDILITEVMADPSPSHGLPETEYIELVNNSAFALDLDQWDLMVNNNRITLTAFLLEPGEHAIITNTSPGHAFADSIRMIKGAKLPVLPNHEGTIALLDSTSATIHAINYSIDWIESEYKQDGAWSLEMIDRTNPCGGKSNWQECGYFMGGTPGWENSVSKAMPDYEEPYVTRIGYLNDSSIRVHFNEPLDTTSINHEFFRIAKRSSPDSLSFEFPLHRYTDLYFPEPFAAFEEYALRIAGRYADCAGNRNSTGQELIFGKPQEPANKDIVFNEVLFNPLPGGAIFIELYNNAEKIIDLQDLSLARMDENDEIHTNHAISESSYLIHPGDYLVLTTDTSWLAANYEICTGILLEPSSMPRLPNDEGHIAILNRELEKINDLHYSSSWHSGWIKNESGVALERLHAESPVQHADNWSSGIAATNFGTPTCRNANFTENTDKKSRFTVDPKLFTPNGDGYNDETVIYYSLEKGNYMLHVTIFNSNGQLITRLKQDEYTGHEGFFTWDGRNNRGLHCPIGIYLVYAEFVSDQGHVEVLKTTCVLGEKVN